MKKLGKNSKNGFTLIELLAVITILALVMGIAIYSIGNVINDQTGNVRLLSVNNLIDAVNATVITNDLSLPATFEVSNAEVIVLRGNSDIEVKYSGEVPTGGILHVDKTGETTAYGLTFSDGYICTMAKGENGCGKMEAKTLIEANSTSSVLKNDPDITGRKVFYGANPNNLIKITENNSEKNYRIVAIESDGTIKVVRENRLTYAEYNTFYDNNYAYDYYPDTNLRNNSMNTYCQYSGDYLGCNAWQAIKGTYKSQASEGTVGTDSKIKKFLNKTYYGNLDSNVKKYIVSTIYNIVPIYWNSTTTTIYNQQVAAPTYNFQNKIVLPSIRDWFLAASSCDSTSQSSGSASCSQNNYLYNNAGTYRWWFMEVTYGLTQGVFGIADDGSTGWWPAGYAGGVKTSFYLSNSVNLTGIGTVSSPYRIV